MSIDTFLTIRCSRCGSVLFNDWITRLPYEACGEYDEYTLKLEPCEVCAESVDVPAPLPPESLL